MPLFSRHFSTTFLLLRDDPQMINLKPAVRKDYLEESSVEEDSTESRPGLDPEMFCSCGLCTAKKSLEESKCCKAFSEFATGG